MAAWLTALSLVPWKDVIEAAPGLAKSAKGLFKRTQGDPSAAESVPVPATGSEAGDALARAVQRVSVLESRLAHTQELQQASDELLTSLASQNAVMVKAIDALDKRCQTFKLALFVVAAALIGTLVWVASIAR